MGLGGQCPWGYGEVPQDPSSGQGNFYVCGHPWV